METQVDGLAAVETREEALYLSVGGQQLYCVVHRPCGEAKGGVLLAGPLGSERTYAYAVWVRWRALTGRGFKVVRFDYRGSGESTGAFEEMSWREWVADGAAAGGLLDGAGPVILHGLRFGAMVAAALMGRGVGEALLTWGRPDGGEQALTELLRNQLAAEAVVAGMRRYGSVDAMAAELEAGRGVEAEGFVIAPRMWREMKAVGAARRDEGARVRHVTLATVPGQVGVRLGRPPFWRPGQVLRPDVDELFGVSLAWLEEAADAIRR